ncbi:hypothetical protein K7432_003552 [Basidiobolus ranarum]|uniref:Chitin-binding type-4 domain-containing protein n=1 Tax=Basidiobolus ranarum TaxID=34480 RepID=A0ABR2W643_9FUNG
MSAIIRILSIVFALAFFAVQVASHGHMSNPQVRTPPGDKDNGLTITRGPNNNMPCGGNPPGKTSTTYKSGSSIGISWEIGAAHKGSCSIDLSTHPDSGFKTIHTWNCAEKTGSQSTSVQLPKGTVCEQCVLRFHWNAELTKENYVNCADVKIN